MTEMPPQPTGPTPASGTSTGTTPFDTSPKGFLAALFDFSFTTFITPMIVKFVYILATVGTGLFFLFFLVTAFKGSAAIGLLVLIVGPVFAIVYLAFVRMTLEFYLAVTRMSQDINQRLPRT